MMDYRALVYSLDETLTPGRIKRDEYPRDIPTEDLEQWMADHGISACVYDERDYHFRLAQLNRQPVVYYWKGDHDVLSLPLLAIV